MGLIRLFEYGITNENFVLRTMAINENENNEDCNDVSCRWVPILAKILKVLLSSFNVNEDKNSLSQNKQLPQNSSIQDTSEHVS